LMTPGNETYRKIKKSTVDDLVLKLPKDGWFLFRCSGST
jgi:hypothetical protein